MVKLKYVNLILLAILAVSILSANYLYGNYQNQYTAFPQINSSDRILIFSPHPDDESLGAGGLIKKARERNATVTVVEMTNGDQMSPNQFQNYLNKVNCSQFEGSVGDLRQVEATKAMKTLGLKEDSIIFLGYPDGGLKPMFQSYWDSDKLFQMSSGSNQFDHSPYNCSYEKNASYCGENVEKNIEQIMDDYHPTIIVYPDNGDEHPDHMATSAFVSYAILDTGYQGQSYTYLVHQADWPKIVSYPNLNQSSSIATTSDAHWFVNKLNTTERNLKKNAIYSYSTQTGSMMAYLMAFTKCNEVYAVYPALKMDKFEGIDSFGYQMPSSSFTNKEHKTKNVTPYGSLMTSGMSYDDQNVYLLLKYDKIQNFQYNYHLKLFKGKKVDYVDLNVRNKEVEYESVSNHSILTSPNPRIQINHDIMIITLPRSIFYGTKSVMMSTDFYDPQTNKEVDHTPWRVFQFSGNSSASVGAGDRLSTSVLTKKSV